MSLYARSNTAGTLFRLTVGKPIKLTQEMILQVDTIEVSGNELGRACVLLDRVKPPREVYTFVGDAAKEVLYNW
jgi:hypothetical protein